MLRKRFLQVLGVSPFVIAGLASNGSRSVAARDAGYCSYVNDKCAGGCGGGCGFNCKRYPYSACSVCVACRQQAVCTQTETVCADGCTAACAFRCKSSSVACDVCDVCHQVEN